eukprot:CAMPEP_0115655598 /NCGR_PEP_ID=MMETSP0272-20121206/43722_1 /TAXON_ID=71861 /ORGANISM="Scrippsiella trochoidea, Strain CCMP3099" /LENGTH=315 /DNA_ID=CAMNT_0003093549 /DNA_START=189 /DNA_END=1140 /DNA_ORIENTATION=+
MTGRLAALAGDPVAVKQRGRAAMLASWPAPPMMRATLALPALRTLSPPGLKESEPKDELRHAQGLASSPWTIQKGPASDSPAAHLLLAPDTLQRWRWNSSPANPEAFDSSLTDNWPLHNVFCTRPGLSVVAQHVCSQLPQVLLVDLRQCWGWALSDLQANAGKLRASNGIRKLANSKKIQPSAQTSLQKNTMSRYRSQGSDTRVSPAVLLDEFPTRLAQHPRDAKVSDASISLRIQEYVLALDVTVQDQTAMQVLETQCDLRHPAQHLLLPEGRTNRALGADAVVQIATLSEIHDDHERPLIDEAVVEANDVRML